MNNNLPRRFIVREQVTPLVPLNMQDTYVGPWFNTYQECWDEFYRTNRANLFGSPYFEFEAGLRENAYPVLRDINAPI
jgi:hypothetical protein